MATAAREYSPRTFTFGTWLTSALDSVRRARLEHETVVALSQLSDRELDDLGLTRGTLLEAARKAVAERG